MGLSSNKTEIYELLRNLIFLFLFKFSFFSLSGFVKIVRHQVYSSDPATVTDYEQVLSSSSGELRKQ